jgi:hypothetical protein
LGKVRGTVAFAGFRDIYLTDTRPDRFAEASQPVLKALKHNEGYEDDNSTPSTGSQNFFAT